MNLRKNLFTPPMNAVGYRQTASGRRTRAYDNPRTPADRVKNTGMMLPEQRVWLENLYSESDLAALSQRIHEIQQELICLAGLKTQAQARVPAAPKAS